MREMPEQKKKHYEMDMCSGSVLKKMLLFSLPLMLSSILQLLFNAADIIVVGRFAGDESLAAVGSTSSLVNLLVNLFVGLSIGSNVLVATYYGAKDKKSLGETVHTAIALSVISGILLTIVGVLGAPVILHMMNTPEEVLNLAVIYLRVYFCGMTPMMLYNFGAAILRAMGDTKRPLYYLTIAGVVNISLNLIFVIVFHWGVFGVGLATTISQIVSAAFVIRCLMKSEGTIRLELSQLKLHKDKLRKILQVGLPAGIQGMLFSVSNVVVQSSVNVFGATVVAGNSAALNIEGFIYASTNAFNQGAVSFTSQNVGAGKYHRINRILFASIGCAMAVGMVMGFGAVLFGNSLLGLYTASPAVIKAGMLRLKIVGTAYVLCSIMDTIVGTLRGLGYSIMPMIVSLLGACAFRIVWIMTVFQIDAFHKIETVYWVYPISWALTSMAHIICYMIVYRKLSRKWKVNL